MSVSLDKIVKVTGTVIAPTFNNLKLICNCLTDSPLVPHGSPGPVLSFKSYADVSSYFGYSSNEALFAQYYFNGFNGALTVPSEILFSYCAEHDSAAYMIGGRIKNSSTVVSAIKALANPAITFVIDGVNYSPSLAQSDFASATTLADIASILNTKLSALIPSSVALVSSSYGTNYPQLIVINGNSIDAFSASISFCPTGNLADLLLLTASSAAYGAFTSQGVQSTTAIMGMDLIMQANANWMGLTWCANINISDPLLIQLCTWIKNAATNFSYPRVLYAWSNAPDDFNLQSTTNIVSLLLNNGFGTRTPDNPTGQVTYDIPLSLIEGAINNPVTNTDVGIYAAFWAAIGAIPNYDLPDAVVDFANKQQEGLPVINITTAQYDSLLLQGFQVYTNFANSNSTYKFTRIGQVGGSFRWLMQIYSFAWLSNAIQNSLATLLSNVKRLPYNARGQAMVSSVLNSVGTQGLSNGVIEIGNTFDQTQILEIIQIVGYDASSQLTQSGYFIYYPPILPSMRVSRSPLQVVFVYTNGGAINTIDVGAVFVE